MIQSSRTWIPLPLLVLSLGLAGCGYSTERERVFKTANTSQDRIRTVAVPVFQSREFRRGLELQLTEALAKRIEAESPFKLAKKGRADTILTGEILEVRQATIGRDFAAVRPRETAATLVVSFTWKDLRTGEILARNPRFVQTVDYVRPLGEGFFHAMQRDMDRLAERIVEQMETDDW
ncbi:MAG: LPS assembly lipoprotein LptE [Phycisphaerae bacterium]